MLLAVGLLLAALTATASASPVLKSPISTGIEADASKARPTVQLPNFIPSAPASKASASASRLSVSGDDFAASRADASPAEPPPPPPTAAVSDDAAPQASIDVKPPPTLVAPTSDFAASSSAPPSDVGGEKAFTAKKDAPAAFTAERVAAPGPTLYCDVISHLSRKAFVEQASDLVGVPGSKEGMLRLFVVGVPEETLRKALTCECQRRPFDPAREQPPVGDGLRPVLRALWTCRPDLELAEFDGDPASWTAEQREEYEARVSGHAPWGSILPRATIVGRLTGWYYSSWWFSSDRERPFGIIVDSSIGASIRSRLVPDGTQPHEVGGERVIGGTRSVRLREWTPDLGVWLRRELIGEALRARDRRSFQRGMSAARADPAIAETQRSLAQCQSDLLVARARSIQSQTLSTPPVGMPLDAPGVLSLAPPPPYAPPTPCIADGRSRYEGIPASALVCPLTGRTMVDPLFNAKSGHTYSGAAIRQWVADRGVDPITQQPTVISDLVVNRLARDLLDVA